MFINKNILYKFIYLNFIIRRVLQLVHASPHVHCIVAFVRHPMELISRARSLGMIGTVPRSLAMQGLDTMEREVEGICDATIEGWARVLELRDYETLGHGRRVAELTARVARRMGLSDSELLRQLET